MIINTNTPNTDQIDSFKFNENLNLDDCLSALKSDGIFVLKNLFSYNFIEMLNKEFDTIFDQYKENTIVDYSEGASGDKRLFNAEKYSEIFDRYITQNKFFDYICRNHTNRIGVGQTMLNHLVYSRGEERNSGAGWHRDNHECQFKVIIYLTNVSIKHGNFQWLTNSNRSSIGDPQPRTPAYSTRFTNETVNQLVWKNNCRIINVEGEAGTIIFADTTYIHRGNIIKEGERKAITRYFF